MKNLLLALNVLLVAAVGFLFYRSYNNTSSGIGGSTYKKGDSALPYKNRIAYFSIDSLESKFDYYKEMKTKLEKIQTEGNSDMENAQKELSSRASQLSQQFQQNPTPELKVKAENEIAQLQEGLQKRKQELDTKLFNESKKMNEDVQLKIRSYLSEYNSQKGFAYILSDEPSIIFYKDSLLNVTVDLIKGLNDRFKKTKQ